MLREMGTNNDARHAGESRNQTSTSGQNSCETSSAAAMDVVASQTTRARRVQRMLCPRPPSPCPRQGRQNRNPNPTTGPCVSTS